LAKRKLKEAEAAWGAAFFVYAFPRNPMKIKRPQLFLLFDLVPMAAQPQKMANLDYHYSCLQMAAAAGGRLDRVYELGKSLFRLRIGKGGEKFDIIARLGERMHLTNMIPQSPESPSAFASLLRKRLGNARLESVQQVSFDRLVLLRFRKEQDYLLYFEMFAKGNLALCDGGGKIIAAYSRQEKGGRKISNGGHYQLPEGRGANPFEAHGYYGAESIREKIALAPFYLDDFFQGAGGKGCIDGAEIEKYVSEKEFSVYYSHGKPAGFSCIKLNDAERALKTGFDKKEVFGGFSEALDEYYSKAEIPTMAKKTPADKKLDRLLRQKQAQQEAVAQMEAEAERLAQCGNGIYLNYGKVRAALEKAKAGKLRKIELEL
jgi:predicted ribosome quality control (RQC) complex YloA/Tae2 family protein